ncbi:BREX system ATP-binding domain-containing protein [Sphaerisporangium fuscum]|uniref:BREX system ATP-binding domain-containing protein n=1 Tax=Sphaerisporangium fuscum TaxID=2835868 RepID=UPI001BDBD7CD|nr:BREX system ATP-binding domain-containing protein [Sphaerisporangium fuscum]
MRGRERERHTVIQALRTAEAGHGATLLVEGEHGTGKSLLLSEAAALAARRGFLTAAGAAEELGELIPLAPLFTALGPSFTGAGLAEEALRDGLDERIRLVERLRARLRECAGTRPVLVILDDLQWADHATLAALRTLHWEPAREPVAWLLARRTARVPAPRRAADDETAHLFGLLERHGAERVELGPLPGDAVAEVAADVLGAAPQPDVLALAAGAGGNPLLLTELLTGLREEGSVEAREGRAHLLSGEPPRRVHLHVRHLLDRLGRETRQLVEAAAVLGRSFSPEDAAELVGKPPAALLPAFDEAFDSGIIATGEHALEFRHELVWRAVVAGIPPPVRHALHHQIGKIMLERGGSAVQAAGHLIEGARPGDTRTLSGLEQAVAQVLPTSPRAAADLALQVVELTDLTDPGRPARVVTAVTATTEAGRLPEAESLIRSTLSRPVPATAAAELRCALSEILFMTGRAEQAVREAEAALTAPDLPGRLRDRAVLALLHGLAVTPGSGRAAREAEAVLAAPDRYGEAAAVGAMTVLAALRWEAGRLHDGLRLAREAVRRARGAPPAVRRAHPRLTLASMLTDLRRLEEARAVVEEAGEEVEALGHGAWLPGAAVLRSRADLVAGRLDDAAARAEAGLRLAEDLGTCLFTPLAASVLATVSLRHGDVRAASEHIEPGRDRRFPHLAGGTPGRYATAAARVLEARDGPADAMKQVAHLYPELRERPGPLVEDPAGAAWLVRLALAVDDRASAESVVAAAEGLADANPGFGTLRTAAAHARGLLDGDVAALARAAEEGADAWARASAAEDLGLALAARGEPDAAVGALNRALAGYEEAGSTRDAARLRRRLRRMGVRHRHWATADRPVSGWASLTDTERAVSLLVAQGWTNRQVADQMFISVHTVAFHLRQIFRKLEVTSRVELTRLVMEQRHDLDRR